MTNDKIIQENARNIAVMNERVKNIEEKVTAMAKNIQSISDKMEDHFVTKDEFNPIKLVVYGLVSTVLLFVLNAFLGIFNT